MKTIKQVVTLLILSLLAYYSQAQDIKILSVASLDGQSYIVNPKDIELLTSDNSRIIAFDYYGSNIGRLICFVKINSNGSVLFQKSYSIPEITGEIHCKELVYKNDFIYALINAASNNGSGDFTDPIVAKINPATGDVIYAYRYSGYYSNSSHNLVALNIHDPISYINGDIISVISYGYNQINSQTVTDSKGYFTLHVTDPNFSGVNSSFYLGDLTNQSEVFIPNMVKFSLANETSSPQIKATLKGICYNTSNMSATRSGFETTFLKSVNSGPGSIYGVTYTLRINGMPIANFTDLKSDIGIGQNISNSNTSYQDNLFLITPPPANVPVDRNGYPMQPYPIPFYYTANFELIPDYKKNESLGSSGQIPFAGRFAQAGANSYDGWVIGKIDFSNNNNQLLASLNALDKYTLRSEESTSLEKRFSISYNRNINSGSPICGVAYRKTVFNPGLNFYYFHSPQNVCVGPLTYYRDDKQIVYQIEDNYKIKFNPNINITSISLRPQTEPTISFFDMCSEFILPSENKILNQEKEVGKINGSDFAALNFIESSTKNSSTKIRQIVNNTSNEMDIYPNPFSDKLTVESRGKSIAGVQVFSSSGILLKCDNKLIEGKQARLDIRNLPKGVYFLRIIDGDGRSVIKSVIKN